MLGPVREERARWRTQVDEATTYLTDHAIQLLIAYKGDRIPTMAVRYSGDMRGLWISNRSEERKLLLLRDATQHCHTLFFDSPLYILRRARAAQQLERLLNELESPQGQ
ncbi:hypothetical protein ABT052_40510 [Streptomyces sp. NPDC002766]|uniref:hypothetical protein n=1 Tax=Streptomyces sp. NPDC002766 TaxID=3154429 RepID=UPI00332B15D2